MLLQLVWCRLEICSCSRQGSCSRHSRHCMSSAQMFDGKSWAYRVKASMARSGGKQQQQPIKNSSSTFLWRSFGQCPLWCSSSSRTSKYVVCVAGLRRRCAIYELDRWARCCCGRERCLVDGIAAAAPAAVVRSTSEATKSPNIRYYYIRNELFRILHIFPTLKFHQS